MDYDEDFMSLEETVGNMDDDARIQHAEHFLDSQDTHDEKNRQYVFGSVNVDGEVRRAKALVKKLKDGRDLEKLKGKHDLENKPQEEYDLKNAGTTKLLLPSTHPIAIPAPKKTKVMHQTQINTFEDKLKFCPTCDMHYNPTIPEELRLHQLEHEKRENFRRDTRGVRGNPIWQETRDDGEHRVHVNRRHPGTQERTWYELALETSVQNGLAGLFDSELWGEIEIEDEFPPAVPGKAKAKRSVPQYKVYAYTIENELVAIAVVQRASRAGAYYCGPATHDENGKLANLRLKEQRYVDMDRSCNVVACVERLWTDAKYRRKGYATTLLDCVLKYFIHGATLRKRQLAFSIPTDEGRQFATSYFESVFHGCPFVVSADDENLVVLDNGMLRTRRPVQRLLKEKRLPGFMFPGESL